MDSVCRTCMRIIDLNETVISINNTDLREKLQVCIPELLLDSVEDPKMCGTCTAALSLSFRFKGLCAQADKTISHCIESNTKDGCVKPLNDLELLTLGHRDIGDIVMGDANHLIIAEEVEIESSQEIEYIPDQLEPLYMLSNIASQVTKVDDHETLQNSVDYDKVSPKLPPKLRGKRSTPVISEISTPPAIVAVEPSPSIEVIVNKPTSSKVVKKSAKTNKKRSRKFVHMTGEDELPLEPVENLVIQNKDSLIRTEIVAKGTKVVVIQSSDAPFQNGAINDKLQTPSPQNAKLQSPSPQNAKLQTPSPQNAKLQTSSPQNAMEVNMAKPDIPSRNMRNRKLANKTPIVDRSYYKEIKAVLGLSNGKIENPPVRQKQLANKKFNKKTSNFSRKIHNSDDPANNPKIPFLNRNITIEIQKMPPDASGKLNGTKLQNDSHQKNENITPNVQSKIEKCRDSRPINQPQNRHHKTDPQNSPAKIDKSHDSLIKNEKVQEKVKNFLCKVSKSKIEENLNTLKNFQTTKIAKVIVERMNYENNSPKLVKKQTNRGISSPNKVAQKKAKKRPIKKHVDDSPPIKKLACSNSGPEYINHLHSSNVQNNQEIECHKQITLKEQLAQTESSKEKPPENEPPLRIRHLPRQCTKKRLNLEVSSPRWENAEKSPAQTNVVSAIRKLFETPQYKTLLHLHTRRKLDSNKIILQNLQDFESFVDDTNKTELPKQQTENSSLPVIKHNKMSRVKTKLTKNVKRIVNRRLNFKKPKQFICEICNEGFKFNHNLKQHMAEHFSAGNNQCCVCDKYFSSVNDLDEHLKLHTDEKPNEGHTSEKPHICTICKRAFMHIDELAIHLTGHVRDEFVCYSCNDTFGEKADLEAHLCTHTGEKSITCDLCPKIFSKRERFRVHRTLHVLKPHQCNHCFILFKDKTRLQRHLDNYTKLETLKAQGRVYHCRVCSRYFVNKRVRNQHIKLHRKNIESF